MDKAPPIKLGTATNQSRIACAAKRGYVVTCPCQRMDEHMSKHLYAQLMEEITGYVVAP
jgi:hypothetical protein